MSDRTTNLYGHARTRILSFNPAGADVPLQGALLIGGLHTHSAPDAATYPYGVLRLQNRRNNNRDDASFSEEGELELILVSRPRASIVTLERIADIVEEALLNYATDAVGWWDVRELVNRTTMPPYPSPADAEMVQVRLLWRYTWWPLYRSQYAGIPPV